MSSSVQSSPSAMMKSHSSALSQRMTVRPLLIPLFLTSRTLLPSSTLRLRLPVMFMMASRSSVTRTADSSGLARR